jgi:hypothetical protein
VPAPSSLPTRHFDPITLRKQQDSSEMFQNDANSIEMAETLLLLRFPVLFEFHSQRQSDEETSRHLKPTTDTKSGIYTSFFA